MLQIRLQGMQRRPLLWTDSNPTVSPHTCAIRLLPALGVAEKWAHLSEDLDGGEVAGALGLHPGLDLGSEPGRELL